MKLKQLKQTNKTMLFATINGKMDNLKTLLSQEKNVKSISDGLLKEINNTFCVKSFDEFIDKFKPTVYSRFLSDESMEYSLNPVDATGWFVHPINLTNGFLKSMIEVIDGKVGVKSIDFNYADCLELLGVKKQADNIATIREEFKLLLEKYQNAEEDSFEKEKYGSLCEEKLMQIIADYNNPLSILPYRIEHLKTIIDKRILSNSKTEVSLIGSNSVVDGVIGYGPDGRIRIESKISEDEKNDVTERVEVLDEDGNIMSSDNDVEDGLALALKQSYELYVSDNNKPTIENMGNMLVRTFLPQYLNGKMKNIDDKKELSKLCEEYNDNQKWVNESLEKFVKEVKSLIEIIVGVKVFFEQAKIKNNKMMPELLITNCEASALTEEILEPFFVATNHTLGNIDEAIWFAILPNVEMNKNDEKDKSDNIKQTGYFKTRKKNIEKTLIVRKTQVVKTVSILAKYEIQTFISFENKETNTFQYISQHGVQEYLDVTESLEKNNEINTYIIPCVPNITIIPENNGVVEKTIKYVPINNDTAEKKEEKAIRIGAVYIGASFLAAGIIAACQSPSYLLNKKLKVESSLPCVRFDIERYSNNVETTVGIEIAGYSDEIENEINEKMYGFVFKSGENATRIKVMTARCLKLDDNDVYEPVFKHTTLTYVKRLLKNSCEGIISKEAIDNFFNGTIKAVFWDKNKNEKYVNALLQDNDIVDYKIDNKTCNITMILKGVEMGLEIEMNNN